MGKTSETFRDSTATEKVFWDQHWACEIRDENGGLVGRGDSFNKEEAEARASEAAAKHDK